MIKIIPGYEGDFFQWLVEQRLKALLVMPQEGKWPQKHAGYEDIAFNNEHEYANLIIETEKSYPEFNFYQLAQEYIAIPDLDDFHQRK